MFDVKVTYHIPETQAKKSQSLDQFPSRDIPPPHLSKDNTSNNNSFSLHCHKHSKDPELMHEMTPGITHGLLKAN